MNGFQKRIGDIFVKGFVYFTAIWCVLALLMQCFFVVLHFSGNDDIAGKVADEIEVRIDGRFTSDPRNFWHNK